MRSVRFGLPAWATLAWAALVPDPASGGEPPGPAEPVAALVARLGSRSPRERAEATRLLGQREDAAPALRAALRSADAEVRRRAKAALDGHTRRRRDRAVRAAEAGELDLFAERVALLPGGADDACWAAAASAARRLAAEADKLGGRDYPLPDAADLSKPLRPLHRDEGLGEMFCGGRHVMPAGGLVGGRVRNCVLLSGGPAEVLSMLADGVYFVAGDLRGRALLAECLLVCDGDVDDARQITDALVVARGSVRVAEGIAGSVVLAGGRVTFTGRRKLVYQSVVKEGRTEFLASAHFFEPASRGVTVEAAEGGVRVAKLTAGKPFALAGFRRGDLIAAVNDAKVATAEAFRKALRRGLAGGQFVEFQVRRDEKPRTLTVGFED